MSACEAIEWQQDDADLLCGLHRAHDDFLRRMGTLMCGNRALAEDLVQETWLRAWRSIGQLREPGAARGWLVTILRRELARHLGRPLHREQVSLDDMLHEPRHECPAQDRVLVEQLMQQLDDQQRRLLDLCVVEGCSYLEVAQALDINPSTVGVRLHRLRQRLREQLLETEVAA